MNSLAKIIELLQITHNKIYKRNFGVNELASLLSIKKDSFDRMIDRNKVPFIEVCNYCYKNNISINSIFYNQSKRSKVKYFSNLCISMDTGFTHDFSDKCYIVTKS